MIDLHSHFLPGIDDGAKNAEESMEMLSDSFAQGITFCAATPHVKIHSDESIGYFLKKREEAVFVLEDRLRKRAVSVPQICCGAEVFLDNDISAYGEIDKLCISGTKLLLVEFSTVEYDGHYSEWLYSLTMKNIIPMIAHVERYPFWEELKRELDGVNVVYQINAKTVLRGSGRKFLLNQYRDGKPIVVSSDMHNTGIRRCRMKDAYAKINKHFPSIAHELFEENPKKLLNK